jgi:EAL domain-containing protein (putative c-di-GMP-specific phosphodiesterase class I)
LSETEFALLLRVEKDLGATALATGQDLLEILTRPFMLRDEIFTIGCSVGIAASNSEDHHPETILRYAALALFNARRAGNNQLRVFDPMLDLYARERHEIERDLSKAIALGQFHIAYQPQMRTDDLTLVGAEALIRWQHPVYGDVRPGRFIPLSEESGFIAKIGEWMIKQACMEAASWPGNAAVAINVSPVEMRDPAFLSHVQSALGRSQLDPRRLELELTEGVLLDPGTQTISTLKALRDLGVKLVLDDFGTGFSSLSYLRSFKFDKVKIDQSFIRHMGDSVEASAVLQAVLGLCGELSIPVCGEGVETKEQLIELKARGCTYAQGYFLGRPMQGEEIHKLLVKPC